MVTMDALTGPRRLSGSSCRRGLDGVGKSTALERRCTSKPVHRHQGGMRVAVEIWKTLVIDRMNITVGIGGKDLHGFVLTQLKGMRDIQADLVPNGKIKIIPSQYTTRLDYHPTKKKKIADIEVGVTKSKHRYFRLGLYPSKFVAGEFEHLKWILSTLLDDFNYQKLYASGNVSYVELAADSLSHAAHSFIPFRPKCGYSAIYVDEK